MAKKAFLVIDMLNDFVNEGGTLVVPGAKDLVPAIKRRMEEARREGAAIIYATDAHRPDDPEFSRWGRHAVKGTWGAQIIDELAPREEDYIIPKRRYSIFYGTELELYLRELGIEEIVFTGVLTNICVFATSLDAYMRGYKVTVPRDSVAALTQREHEFALEQIENLCEADIV